MIPNSTNHIKLEIEKLSLAFIFIFIVNSLYAQPLKLKWADQFGGIGNDYARSVAIDPSGNVYTIGFFNDTVDFDPGTKVSKINSAGGWDVFVTKVDPSGNFLWAKRMGGAATDFGYSIAVDQVGNVYTTGFFSGTADFDNGGGAANLTAIGSTDVFVCKLDASGGFTWVAQLGGAGDEVGYSIAIDPAGNVYTTGYFTGTVDFDPGPAVNNLTSAGVSDVFVSKLDPFGNFAWAKQMGGPSSDIANSIVLDAAGNVYTTGSFTGTADFDPSTTSTVNLVSAGLSDIFVSKLTANGDFVLAKSMGGDSVDAGFSIAVDGAGYIYTTGNYIDSADFDPGTGVSGFVSLGGNDIFISKLTSLGNFVWAKSIGSTSIDQGYSIALDDSSNVYTTGYFQGTADFDPGAGTSNLTSAGSFDIFISKLDSSGKYVSANQLGGSGVDQGYFITCDHSGNIYTSGSFTGTADFDPGANILNFTTLGFNDAFVEKMSQRPGLGIHSSETRNSTLIITPNPAYEKITISGMGPNEKAEYTLFNAFGQVMLSGLFEANELNISSLKNGLYFLEIKEEGTSATIKFVKN